MIHQIEPHITNAEIEAVSRYLHSGGWLTEFKETEKFEKAVAEFLGVKYAVAVTSGTAALYLALKACGIGHDDKVIVPNYTMIATINAIVWADATPVIVDTDDMLCIDIDKLDINESYKAMLYVPINGRSNNMSRVLEFCNLNDIRLIEDACQAFGSMDNGQYLGTFGEAGVFSFTPHKAITTGQGGMVVTNNILVYEQLKKLKDFGRVAIGVDEHNCLGFNFKFTDLQAVIGLSQMKTINMRLQRKKEIYTVYKNHLKDMPITLLPVKHETVPWFVDIILESNDTRNRLAAYLQDKKIGCRNFYPPINYQPIYAMDKHKYRCSEDIAPRGLWLPSSMTLSDSDIIKVCKIIREFFENE
jgi:perosamine synthetase